MENTLKQSKKDLENLGFSFSKRCNELVKIFSMRGPLASTSNKYIFRSSQLRMAIAINAVIEKNVFLDDFYKKNTEYTKKKQPADGKKNEDSTLIIEAGTGTGKTFAYLIPAILHGGKSIISTGSKHLQDQIFSRDIPYLQKKLTIPFTTALLKGRANYVCLYYLHEEYDKESSFSDKEINQLRDIKTLSKKAISGDRTDFGSIPEDAAIWQKITSSRESCLGQECSFYKDCFVMKARRNALKADIVIVNHHLFFADILLRDTGFTELLPESNTVIFDEAHLLPDIASRFFGDSVSTAQLTDLSYDLLRSGKDQGEIDYKWQKLHEKLLRATTSIHNCINNLSRKILITELLANQSFENGLKDIINITKEMRGHLACNPTKSKIIEQYVERASQIEEKLINWQKSYYYARKTHTNCGAIFKTHTKKIEKEEKYISWVEIFKQSIHLHLTPLSISEIFKKYRLSSMTSWIFISATLSVKGIFSHYAQQLGLNEKHALLLPSPFNYQKQALLYVPNEIPNPTDKNFSDALVKLTFPFILANKGRALILCTTLRAVDELSKKYCEQFKRMNSNFTVLTQGQMNRFSLMQRFAKSTNTVLIGSQSFWEGIDLPGEILSLLIIDKLPFDPPDDPITSARLNAISSDGKSPFLDYQIPRAVLSLKQGAGRLIRLESDKGLLIICDQRIVNMPYGKKFWQSLPPFQRTRNFDEALEFTKKI